MNSGNVRYIELRKFVLRRGLMPERFNEYFGRAAMPALNRLGCFPVGLLHVLVGPENPSALAVIPHASEVSALSAWDRLKSDPDYRREAASFLNAPPDNPAFLKVETIILKAFPSMQQIAISGGTSPTDPRIFELRRYESHGEAAADSKVRMFEEGEIALFRKVGLRPVFFGKTLSGAPMPSLHYLVAFRSQSEREEGWSRFLSHPEWRKMSTLPGNTDAEIVSSISSVLLRPADCSQI